MILNETSKFGQKVCPMMRRVTSPRRNQMGKLMSKKGRSSKRQIPTSDRLTRSVAKKTETTTLMEYAGYPSTGIPKIISKICFVLMLFNC